MVRKEKESEAQRFVKVRDNLESTIRELEAQIDSLKANAGD